MEEAIFRLDGAAIYWKAGECSRRYLLQLIETLMGGTDALFPEKRQHPTILRESIELVIHGHKTLRCRPTKDRRTFTIHHEIKGTSINDYPPVAAVSIDKAEHITLETYSADAPDVELVRATYEARRRVVTVAQITSYLKAHVLGPLTGTMLREDGGVYWIPDAAVPGWRRLTDAVSNAASDSDKPTRAYLIRHRFDEDGLRAVRDAITNEIEAATADIRRGAADPTEGQRAHETRRALARDLADKARSYEGILGESLAGLVAAAQLAETAAATAALAAAAAAAREQGGFSYAHTA